ncbi:hypothetical protein BUALT_Bualt07G0034500 [Buddleja alternifolia]|uniref:Uncharacterized protein n=1 Tax=Buddleja alternifolia TaxID=168488 RepID=A0AAV6XFV2_9LAMI|nr:hypothetical protein BUALT_Bualt07G0034500 [Buddleja alternifolia]
MYKDHNSAWTFLYAYARCLLVLGIFIKFFVMIFVPVAHALLPDANMYLRMVGLFYAVSLIPKLANYIVENVDGDHGLLQVLEETVSITKEVIKIRDQFGVGSNSGGSGKNVVVGFERDLEEIRDRLSGASSKLEIVSIVGMAGIGKTTLARKVYGDSYIVYHFHIRAWVAVSRECSLRQVVLGLLDSFGILTDEMRKESDDELCDNLYKSLKGRRYLIIMDDMWETEIWDEVRRLFPDDCVGSRVLLSTRLSDVARYANSVSLHEMQFLNEDESWSLLCKKVFLTEEDCPPELRKVGRKIARNCGGLPLAIVVIGGLLHQGEKTIEYWRRIAKNINSIISKDKRCMEILSLSYNHLPHHLRPCFLYMAVFPEDYEIAVPKLICLWIAEGFFKPNRSKRFEESAEEYLEDLIKRNLIMVSKWSSNGKIKTCNVHDLLRDLCIHNARKEHFLDVVKDDNDLHRVAINTPRRLSVSPNILQSPPGTLYNAHSLLCSGTRLTSQQSIYLGYRLLRVLDVAIVHFDSFPFEIFRLVNLRYLAFTYIGSLPASISHLWNLETIVLHGWTYHQCFALPVEIWAMLKLRHLCVPPSFFPDARDAWFSQNNLENLQTLLEVRNFRCGLDILEGIRNIKSLGVSYNVEMRSFLGWSAYQLENLACLDKLETLKVLVMDYSDILLDNPLKLAFPENLKRLTLSGCKLPWESMTIVGALPSLEVLRLRRNACEGTTWEPVEGQFCKLKFLLLQQIDLVEWVADETHFPRLQRLVIRCCYKLEEIPPGMGEITTLEIIELADSYPSAVDSAKQIQEEQEENMGSSHLQVRIDYVQHFKKKSTM